MMTLQMATLFFSSSEHTEVKYGKFLPTVQLLFRNLYRTKILHNSTVQYSTVQYSTVQYSTVQQYSSTVSAKPEEQRSTGEAGRAEYYYYYAAHSK